MVDGAFVVDVVWCSDVAPLCERRHRVVEGAFVAGEVSCSDVAPLSERRHRLLHARAITAPPLVARRSA